MAPQSRLMQKALLIDDDPLLLERMQAALQRQGFEVLTAANGESGVNLARAQLPAIIICDVNFKGV
jgi:DNA-binding response OmpR family regulator